MTTDIFTQIETHRARTTKIRNYNRSAIAAALEAQQVATVTIEFNGSGDEGQVEPAALFNVDGQPIEMPDVNVEVLIDRVGGEPLASNESLAAALESFAYDALSDLHGGWQDNEGAYGELIIDVATGKATLDFNARIIESINTTTQL